MTESNDTQKYDLLVVGAGFSGLYMIHQAHRMGLSVLAIDRADDVGGTWYWNRYPGARCDIESVDYCYSFSPELVADWNWSERYATQPEILSYLQHVADVFDLRKDIEFGRELISTHWNEADRTWITTLDNGTDVVSRFVVMAVGNLTSLNAPDFPGLDTFKGRTFHTGTWPHKAIDFFGRRVAVIGTGSSGIQTIPKVAEQADQLYVLQRTPNYSMPARNRPLSDEERAVIKAENHHRKARSKRNESGIPSMAATTATSAVDDGERQNRYQEGWERGGVMALTGCFNNLFESEEANITAQDFARSKILEIVEDAETARRLLPSHHIGTKRTCVDTDYYQTYNRSNVELVDVREDPIVGITENGIQTRDRLLKVDDIIFATGFDAITGALTAVDIRGVGGLTIQESWSAGPRTYLGLQISGFPNLFMVTGPQSPASQSNAALAIEHHVELISEALAHMKENSLDRIEASVEAQDDWVAHALEVAEGTLYLKTTNSWYHGANIPGKPKAFLPYVGGAAKYRSICQDIFSDGYRGFEFAGPSDPPA
ncbi:NAD(P)/FAD-dependent oxidoreductase [Streptomyces sp. NPDC004610]|uniref:flavin-containing monooxygenase n=1 Tax=unclassified Streptomyces TaxID=2593676 RepID=UPI0033B002AC